MSRVAGRARRLELDDVDRALVAALGRDGRAPNVELARALGVSEKTVRSRIARLVSDHGLRVTAELAEPVRRSRMVYLIHAGPGRRFEVAEFLATLPGVDVVHLTTGSADVLAVASFPDDAAALRFLVQTVETHPGVRSAQSCHLITEVGGSRVPGAATGPRVDTEALAAVLIGPPRYATLDELTDTICDAAVAGLGADRVLVATAATGGEISGITGGATSTATGAGRDMGVAKTRRLSGRYIEALNGRIAGGRTDGVIKRVWQTRLHVLVADARTDPLMANAHDLVRAEGYVTLLTLPMLYGDALVATVSLYYDAPAALDDGYIATAQGVADGFAVAVARMVGRAPTVRG
jgi:DNA-binding Lrp family transcriptional regulator